jgi:hypothetical protein
VGALQLTRRRKTSFPGLSSVNETSESGTSFPEGGTSFEEAAVHHDARRETFHFHHSGFVV